MRGWSNQYSTANPRRRQLPPVKVTDDELRDVQQAAIERGTSVADVIRGALEAAGVLRKAPLAREPKPNPPPAAPARLTKPAF